MKAKIYFSKVRNGKTKKLREIYNESRNPIWINPHFMTQKNFNSLKWTKGIDDVDSLLIDDVPEFFDFSVIINIVKSGLMPIYQGKNKPFKMIEAPKIIITSNYCPSKNDLNATRYFEVYEFPNITDQIN